MKYLLQDKFRQRAAMNALALLVVLVMIGALFFLVRTIKASVAPQNCHMAGFWNCQTPIVVPQKTPGPP